MKANSKYTVKRFFEILAQADIFFDLARKYVSFVTFGMVGVMFFIDMNFGLLLNILCALGIILAIIVVVIFDWFYIYPRKLKKLSMNNPATMQILKNTGDGKIEY